MKQIVLEKTDLASCVDQAQHERVVIVRKDKPVALIVGVEGMDPEQLELGSSEKFWKLIERRRKQKGISRAKLEKKLNGSKLPSDH
jgi:antitoxin (DNA-binding transcriptional repressor) of toxin-antitoxin stability system